MYLSTEKQLVEASIIQETGVSARTKDGTDANGRLVEVEV